MTTRTRLGWKKFRECGEILFGKQFSVQMKEKIYKKINKLVGLDKMDNLLDKMDKIFLIKFQWVKFFLVSESLIMRCAIGGNT